MNSDSVSAVALIANWADLDAIVEVCKGWREAVLQVSATLLHRFRPMIVGDEFGLNDDRSCRMFLDVIFRDGRWRPASYSDARTFGWMRPRILEYIENQRA
jgi:hypothetical protein